MNFFEFVWVKNVSYNFSAQSYKENVFWIRIEKTIYIIEKVSKF